MHAHIVSRVLGDFGGDDDLALLGELDCVADEI